jgi:hypothetical protein
MFTPINGTTRELSGKFNRRGDLQPAIRLENTRIIDHVSQISEDRMLGNIGNTPAE